MTVDSGSAKRASDTRIPTDPNWYSLLLNPMHRQSVLRLVRQSGSFAQAELPPAYLAPSLHFTRVRTPTQSPSFSSTAVAAGRDLNRSRGVSAIHHTGPKGPLGSQKYPLPRPVSPEKIERRNPTPDHGLWGFFPPDRQPLSTPEYDISFGEWCELDSSTCTHILHRPVLVDPRTPGKIMGRPPLSVVGLRQGAQSHSDLGLGTGTTERWIWRVRVHRAGENGSYCPVVKLLRYDANVILDPSHSASHSACSARAMERLGGCTEAVSEGAAA